MAKYVLEAAKTALYKRGYSVQDLKGEKAKGAKQEHNEMQRIKKGNAKEGYEWDNSDLFILIFLRLSFC